MKDWSTHLTTKIPIGPITTALALTGLWLTTSPIIPFFHHRDFAGYVLVIGPILIVASIYISICYPRQKDRPATIPKTVLQRILRGAFRFGSLFARVTAFLTIWAILFCFSEGYPCEALARGFRPGPGVTFLDCVPFLSIVVVVGFIGGAVLGLILQLIMTLVDCNKAARSVHSTRRRSSGRSDVSVTRCLDCRENIAGQSRVCPRCGAPFSDSRRRRISWISAFLLAALIFLIWHLYRGDQGFLDRGSRLLRKPLSVPRRFHRNFRAPSQRQPSPFPTELRVAE